MDTTETNNSNLNSEPILNNIAGQCFNLLNRKGNITTEEIFFKKFDEEARKGHIYIQWQGNEIQAYLRGQIQEIAGEKVFYISEMASNFKEPRAVLGFIKNIVMAQKQFFKYIGFYRQKNESTYLIELWLPGNRFGIRKLKGVNPWQNQANGPSLSQ